MKIAVIGAGNGGQAIAGYLASEGHDVNLFDRNKEKVVGIGFLGKSIVLKGSIQCQGVLRMVTDQLALAIKNVDLIMVATTATAHRFLAKDMATLLEEGQVVVLNPGRTGGALEFRKVLEECGCKTRIFLAEAQTLIYACRSMKLGFVNIIGVKDKVLLAALPSSDTGYVLQMLSELYGCFVAANSVLTTGFENIGAVFHPGIVLFNAAAIERGNMFYFYRDMTPRIAAFVEALDKERLSVAKAYGVDAISAKDWVAYAYNGVEGNTLCERMRNNPAYNDIVAPSQIDCRQITEDIPTGLIPLAEFGKMAGVDTPLSHSVITACCELLNTDFWKEGRTLKNMGLNMKTISDIVYGTN